MKFSKRALKGRITRKKNNIVDGFASILALFFIILFIPACFGSCGSDSKEVNTKAESESSEPEQIEIIADTKSSKKPSIKPNIKPDQKVELTKIKSKYPEPPKLIILPNKPRLGKEPIKPDKTTLFKNKLKNISEYIKYWPGPKIGDEIKFITMDAKIVRGIIIALSDDSLTLSGKHAGTYTKEHMRQYYQQKYFKNEHVKHRIKFDIENIQANYDRRFKIYIKPLKLWQEKCQKINQENKILIRNHKRVIANINHQINKEIAREVARKAERARLVRERELEVQQAYQRSQRTYTPSSSGGRTTTVRGHYRTSKNGKRYWVRSHTRRY